MRYTVDGKRLSSAVFFSVPLPPSVNRIWRCVPSGHGRQGVVLTTHARRWKQAAAWAARIAGAMSASGPISVNITMHPRLTKAGLPSKRRLDLDNVLKLLLDSLNGVAYDDDQQVTHIDIRIGEARNDGELAVVIEHDATPNLEGS